ncbi:MAG: LuxR C-terminal-related transcriptional regulator [Thermomicrobiales bacterium]
MADATSTAISGWRIRGIRQVMGLSQIEFATLLGISNVTVNRWENDRAIPQPGMVERLLHLEASAPGVALPGERLPTGNLPRVTGLIVGREADVALVAARLVASPLVTITGPAGAGKTRLAVEIARREGRRHPDGAWFVDLAAVSDPGDVQHAVARVLGIRETARKSLIARLVEEVRERSRLLVLDNCEHLVAASADLANDLIGAGGESRLLATSRIPLGIPGEAIYPLRPLAPNDAAALFVRRAREHQPELDVDESREAIAEICRRLDGLPLAIELAAARAHILSVAQIAGRLDRRFELLRTGGTAAPRQRALDTAIAWSCDLLTPDAAMLFRRLGVFAGWFDLEAVEAVAANDNALDLLDHLARQSMIVVEQDSYSRSARYRLLESLAAYARDLLKDLGELAATADRHAAYYGALAGKLSEGLRGPRQTAFLSRLEHEHDNLIAALEWQLTAGDAASTIALAASLGPYWRLRSLYDEGISWLSRALAREGAATVPRVNALNELGLLQYHAGSFPDALTTLETAVALAGQLGDRSGEARALDTLGLVLVAQRNLVPAAAAHERALALALAVGDRAQAALSRLHLGNMANLRGDHKAAERGYHDAWSLIQGTGDVASEALILSNLGEIAARTGRYSRALNYYQRTLHLLETVGDPDRLAAVGTNTAEIQLILGNAADAVRLATEAVARYREINHPAHLADALYIQAAALAAVGKRGAALALFQEMLALEQAHHDWIDSVYAIEAIARLIAEDGDPALAARLLGALEVLREQHQVADYPLFDLNGTIASVQTALGEAAMAEYWAEGRSLSPQQAVAEASLAGSMRDGAPIQLLKGTAPPTVSYRSGSLTARQIEILRRVAAGMSNREIGEDLAISERTVERHLTSIFAALDVDRRPAAVARAVALGLVER